MTESVPTDTWQPEPAAIHPSLDRYQRLSAFTLDPTPPPGGARMVKGMAYHAVCGTSMTSKVLDDPAFGEYGCRTCGERGYLVKVPAADLPDPQHQARPTGAPMAPTATETRALAAVEVAERLSVKAHQALSTIPEGDLSMAPLSVIDAIQRAQALLEEIATTTTNTTCSLVKDQAWSDRISRSATASVRQSLERIESATTAQ
jgi:hypothetical protein